MLALKNSVEVVEQILEIRRFMHAGDADETKISSIYGPSRRYGGHFE